MAFFLKNVLKSSGLKNVSKSLCSYLLPKPHLCSTQNPIYSRIRFFSNQTLGLPIAEYFNFQTMTKSDFHKKITAFSNRFPVVDEHTCMRRTVSDLPDVDKNFNKFVFVAVSFGEDDCGTVYPLVSMESTYFLGIQVNERLFVFDDEDHFSKKVVPKLTVHPDDITYVDVNFSTDFGHLDFFCIEKAVKYLILGYSEDKCKYFMECLALVYGAVVRSCVFPEMSEFVSEILGGRYGGDGKPPAFVTSLSGSWGAISKWYFKGGIGLFEVGDKSLDLFAMKMHVAIVKSGKSDEQTLELEKGWNPGKMYGNAEKRKLKFTKEQQEKQKLFMGQQENRRKRFLFEEEQMNQVINDTNGREKREAEFLEAQQNLHNIFMEEQQSRWNRFFVEEEERSKRIKDKFKPKG